MIPFSPEIVTMGFSALSGFMFKAIAVSMDNRKKLFEMALKGKQEADISSDKASKRRTSNVGKITRRVIVFSIFSLFFILPFTPLLDINTVVEVKELSPRWLWGIFGGNERTTFEIIDGYYFSDSIKQGLLCIVGFYFGQSSARA